MNANDARILVVDDEESLRELLSSLLTDEGYEVTTASSAEQALELFSPAPYPIVLADIRLEGMNGVDLLKKIKTLNEDSQVVLITSHASLNTAIAALRAGVYDYIIKPFEDLEQITTLVAHAWEKARLVIENRRLIDELQASNKVLRELAVVDGLTHLYNHRFFQESLAKHLSLSTRNKRTLSLLFIDVDHFKQYNDTHGHPEGDNVLKTLAGIMSKRLRTSDLIARYGGEEFVVLLPETSEAGALVVAENLRISVESHTFKGGDSQPLGKVTISVGVAVFPETATEGADLIRKADQALYKAKNEGRNRLCLADKDTSIDLE